MTRWEQMGKEVAMFRWTWDGVRVALHTDGTVSYRSYRRRKPLGVHEAQISAHDCDLRTHPLWNIDVPMFTLFEVKCKLTTDV